MKTSVELAILPPKVGWAGLSPLPSGFLLYKLRNKLAQCRALFGAYLFPRVRVSSARPFPFRQPSKLVSQFTWKIRLSYRRMFPQKSQYLSLAPYVELEGEKRLLIAVKPL